MVILNTRDILTCGRRVVLANILELKYIDLVVCELNYIEQLRTIWSIKRLT